MITIQIRVIDENEGIIHVLGTGGYQISCFDVCRVSSVLWELRKHGDTHSFSSLKYRAASTIAALSRAVPDVYNLHGLFNQIDK